MKKVILSTLLASVIFLTKTIINTQILAAPPASVDCDIYCTWEDARVQKCNVKDVVCPKDVYPPMFFTINCTSHGSRSSCEGGPTTVTGDYVVPIDQPQSFFPPAGASCPAARPNGVCSFTYPDGVGGNTCITQGSECDGNGIKQPYYCCAHPANCNTSSGEIGVNTPFGCIPINNPNTMATFFLRIALGVSGGLSILFIIFAAIQITTSAGNPDKLAAGKEMLTSSITGLLLIIFAVFVLRQIGLKILQIPGL